MESGIVRISGMAKLEQILQKIDAIQEKFTTIQDTMTFRSALDHAQERHSTDGKTAQLTGGGMRRPQSTTQKAGSETPAERQASTQGSAAAGLNAPPERNHSLEKRLMETLRRELPKHNIPPDLALAVMQAESGFNPSAVSPKGAVGVMQLMPSTAAGLGVGDEKDLLEPEVNIPTGLQYLSRLLAQYGGNEEMALAAYNAGPGAVSRHGGVPPFQETRDYIKRVFDIRRRLNTADSES